MSHAEFFASLFRYATGWLGWPPAVALATPIPQIEAAMEGRIDMLKAIFGGAEKEKPVADLTPMAFDAVFGTVAQANRT
ncbi:hypothetical protein K9U40_09375 [Xanthobacter autotrophicus]|uniref:hypothetical protein n=1 Tax=Xanthobacter TaxID=279 RepID=UPI0024ABAD58|nr:hypothetical protein [Xanthobacter autotrophicus]MDI4664534.1 hypothetical protein [Xanthobacter autotrophicus]